MEILEVSFQTVHGRFRIENNPQWFVLTAVYASPTISWRKYLWDYLSSINPGPDFPWLLGGDFNATLRPDEQIGGFSIGTRFSKSFYDFVHGQELFEVDYKGSDFTWKRGSLYKHLDRCFINEHWFSKFPNSLVFHLDRLGSDHCPLLFHMQEERKSSVSKPFRYLAYWQDHHEFAEVISST
ncbi:hypothetical protein V6N13_082840 [Hibiscus sabdariffa]